MNAPWGSNALRLVGPRAHQPPSPSRVESRRGLGRTERPNPSRQTGMNGHDFDQHTGVLPSLLVGRDHLGNPGGKEV